jgi:hypothetical protein
VQEFDDIRSLPMCYHYRAFYGSLAECMRLAVLRYPWMTETGGPAYYHTERQVLYVPMNWRRDE